MMLMKRRQEHGEIVPNKNALNRNILFLSFSFLFLCTLT